MNSAKFLDHRSGEGKKPARGRFPASTLIIRGISDLNKNFFSWTREKGRELLKEELTAKKVWRKVPQQDRLWGVFDVDYNLIIYVSTIMILYPKVQGTHFPAGLGL